MRVFVAGASAEAERVRAAMDRVEVEGWTLALDWLAAIEKEGTANDMPRAKRATYALIDWDAVRGADVLWLLAPHRPSTGAWVELGLALAHGVRVVTSGPASERCIYAACGAEVLEDRDAIDVLRRLEE